MLHILQRFFPQLGQEEIQNAKQQAKQIIIDAEEEALKIKREAGREAQKTVDEALNIEKRLEKKEQNIEDRLNEIEKEKKGFENTRKQIAQIKKDQETKREEILQKLEKISGLSKEEARKILLSGWEEKLQADIAKKIKASEEEIKGAVDEKAKELLLDAMRYGATDYVAEYTLSVIKLPDDEFKGRIIGKDGRNIRAFELATGVDVDMEEDGVIRLSSFDSIRREIARLSLERMIKDGRVQPQRIEEIVQKTKQDVGKAVFKAGEDLAHRVNVYNLPNEIVRMLGKFKYRSSFGQNMILHTLEETRIGVALANELGADVNVVKLGCLLHDIGKVVDDKEGSHVELGVEVAKKFRFPQRVINVIAEHHEDVPFTSVESIIVYIADAVSGGRPGARHEDLENYAQRIKTIEEAAKLNKGVRDVYALQAGRELRVIVKPDEIDDNEATILAQKISKELEAKFDVFPGNIKVSVLREFRAESVARF